MTTLADIGNSNIKIACSKTNGISKVKIFKISEINKSYKYLNRLNKDYRSYIFYSSVLDKSHNEKIEKSFKKIFLKTKRFTSKKTLFGVSNAYHNFTKLGSDRWAQIVACNKLFNARHSVIISCGSAISLDYLTSKGKHMGGLIFSGAERYTNSFNDIESLRNINLSYKQKTNNIIETNTKDQIISGYTLMITAAIENIIDSIMRKNRSNLNIIISGSYAGYISNNIKYDCIIEPYFVLKSLNWIANN